ncbi:MAG: heparan-alpha-glucosaminide N-acetyltransferase domain-containing protein [Vicinamibacterales bacterium]
MTRLRQIDIVRGLIMVLMAIDHVRVFAGVPAGGPTAGLFFTRWVTHFCAPGFVFFAGTSAYLYGKKAGSLPGLSRFLLGRGLWLVLLELTLMRLAWTFNFDLWNYNLAGVLWMIGWCLVALSALVWLPAQVVGVFGVMMIACHNLLDPHVRSLVQSLADDPLAWAWQVMYFGGSFRLAGTGPRLVILYSLVPWIGVMAAGYGFGLVLELPPARRTRGCLIIGIAAITAFVLLRTFNIYGDPRPWGGPNFPAVFSFLNTNKYPASLLFLLMTLGPLITLLPLVEHARGRLAGALELFGRAPLFYYVLHIPLIHLLAVGVSLVRSGGVTPWLFGNHPMEPPPPPDGYAWSLWLLYAITALAIVLLYFACTWFVEYQRRSRSLLARYF